jgi:hypothetical protein
MPVPPVNYTSFLLLGRNMPTYEQNFVALTATQLTTAGLNFGDSSTVPPVFGAWTCYVWALDLEETNGSLTLSADSRVVVGPITGKTQDTTPVHYLVLMAQVYQPQMSQGPFDLWFDDVRLATTPLDCSSP